jgi:hypothetical protein
MPQCVTERYISSKVHGVTFPEDSNRSLDTIKSELLTVSLNK